jgi:hypothetical protein
VSDKEAGACADRCGEDRDILRVRKLARPFAVARRRTVDLDRDRAQEFLEQRRGFGKLRGQVSADFVYGGLGQHQTQKADFTEDQNRVAGAGP